MHSRLLSFAVAIGLVTPLAARAQTGGFVAMLGTDTTVIERYTRSGTSIEGTVLRRSPMATLTKYTATLGGDGSVTRVTQVTTRADGSAPPNGATPLTMTFAGDSVIREIVQNGVPVTLRTAVPKGTLPGINGSYLFTERMIQAAKKGGDVVTIGFAAQATPTKADIRMISRDSVEIVNGGFRTGYRIDKDGRIKRIDGSLTTQKFVVTPQSRLDVDAIASAWAARDAAGQAMGAASTRDTVNAAVGTAHVMLEYGRPAKRGREIWGKLVPFDTTWRFGANAAAQFRTDKALVIGGTTVEPGFYTLWLNPSEKAQSVLIVNSQTGQWGTAYDGKKDVARIPVEKQGTRATPEERFTVTIEGDRLLMTWDRGGYVVSIKEK